MTKLIKAVYIVMVVMAIPSFAEDYIDLYAGRGKEGEKKYISWPVSDSIKISVNYSPSDEVTKVLYSCLVDYDQISWDVASVVDVDYDDEVDEALIKIKLQYIWAKRFMRATLTKDGKLTCHGTRTD